MRLLSRYRQHYTGRLHGSGSPVFGNTLHAFVASNAADAGSGLVTLPSWLTITCATTGRTSQTSASTIKAGFGANAARARNAGGGIGLSVENAMTNGNWRSNTLGSWNQQAGVAITENVVVGPDGALVADELDVSLAADGTGAYVASDARAIVKTQSVWGLQSGGACTMTISNPQTGVPSVDIVLGTSWSRFECSAPVNAGTGVWLRRKPSGTNKGYFCYAQSEEHAYPTSALPAAGVDVARAADVLSCTASVIAPGGFFDVLLVVAPNYANDETSVDHDLFYLDANNRLYFDASDEKVYFHFGGAADLSSAALTFDRETELIVRASYRASGRRLTIYSADYATTVYDSGSQAAGAAISLPATAYLLGDNTGAQECADLREIQIYRP